MSVENPLWGAPRIHGEPVGLSALGGVAGVIFTWGSCLRAGGGLVADCRSMGSGFGAHVFDAGRDTLWLVAARTIGLRIVDLSFLRRGMHSLRK